MAGANYEYCPTCNHKALYVGENDVPEHVVVHHKECHEADCNERIRETLERLKAKFTPEIPAWYQGDTHTEIDNAWVLEEIEQELAALPAKKETP